MKAPSVDDDDKIALVNRTVVPAFRDFEKAIALLVKKKWGPLGLILTYSAIDFAGWLDCAGDETKPSDYERWIDKYMLPSSDLNCTAVEIYAARCGLVHTYAPESRLSRKGIVRQLRYAWGRAQADQLQRWIDDDKGNEVLAVHGYKLIEAFQTGLHRFRRKIEDNPDCFARVHAKAGRVFRRFEVGTDVQKGGDQ